MTKSGSRSEQDVASSGSSSSEQDAASSKEANESVLFAGINLAQAGSVEAVLQALDIPSATDHEKEKEDRIRIRRPLSSTPTLRSARRSPSSPSLLTSARLGSQEVGLQASAVPTCSQTENREDGFPRLTSADSPLIKSKSSKSSSNQGSLPGLVVAPDGVTLVKDRRKCKPRGVLTVGLETFSFSSDGETVLPVPSPSVATVKWVDEHWNDSPSRQQSHPDELDGSSSTVTSTSVSSPRSDLNFGSDQDCTKELGVRDAWSNAAEGLELGREIVPSIQESNDLKESVDVSPPADLNFAESHDLKESVDDSPPADLNFADNDVSTLPPELAPERLPFGNDYSVPSSSSKQPQCIGSTQEISSQNHMVLSDTDNHYLDIHSLQLEPQDDVNGSSSVENIERSCDYSSDRIPLIQSETTYLTMENAESHLGMSENPSSESESVFPLPVSPSLLGSLGNEDARRAPLGGMTDADFARDSPIIMNKHGEGSEICGFSSEQLVAETLYELAAENLRKTRTAARTFNSPEEKKSSMESTSSLSIVKQPVFSADTSSNGEYATRTDAVPRALSSRLFTQGGPRPEVAKLDFAQPLRTIVLSGDGQFSDELATLKALIGNVHVGAQDSLVQGIPRAFRGVHEEAPNPAESISPFPKKPQRQRRRLSYGYHTSIRSPIRKAQQQQQQQRRRLSSCGKRVGFGSMLAAITAFGVVFISLAMGSCQQCYKSNHYQYYIRPT